MDAIILRNRTWQEVIREHYEKNSRKSILRLQGRLGSVQAAEDVVHDAYERALRYSSSFSGEKFNSWFGTITRNALNDYLAAERGVVDTVEVDEFDFIGGYCEGYSNKLWEELESLIERKGESHAEVLRLFFYQGYRYKDIANVTEHTYHNVYRIVERFKAEILKRYKE